VTWSFRRNPVRLLIAILLAVASVLVALPAAAAPGTSTGRRGRLERAALDLAVRLRAVPVRDGDFADPRRYCPRDRLAASWTAPAGTFRFGAYIPPLGPRPGPATTSVNGVVICRGATYASMGFEARWATGGWQVVDVPALDEPAHEPASGRPSGPYAAVPPAVMLPPVGAAPLDDLAPYQPQTTATLAQARRGRIPADRPGLVPEHSQLRHLAGLLRRRPQRAQGRPGLGLGRGRERPCSPRGCSQGVPSPGTAPRSPTASPPEQGPTCRA
jgi:hypothetical protein